MSASRTTLVLGSDAQIMVRSLSNVVSRGTLSTHQLNCLNNNMAYSIQYSISLPAFKANREN